MFDDLEEELYLFRKKEEYERGEENLNFGYDNWFDVEKENENKDTN